MTTQTASTLSKPQRRWDIDWLRVLAVLMLFPFHTARIFNNYEPFYVKNAEWSDALTYFIYIVHPWHMPLLFLLAGASTWFALGFRSGRQYTKERFVRLLIPFIFGLLVIVPLDLNRRIFSRTRSLAASRAGTRCTRGSSRSGLALR